MSVELNCAFASAYSITLPSFITTSARPFTILENFSLRRDIAVNAIYNAYRKPTPQSVMNSGALPVRARLRLDPTIIINATSIAALPANARRGISRYRNNAYTKIIDARTHICHHSISFASCPTISLSTSTIYYLMSDTLRGRSVPYIIRQHDRTEAAFRLNDDKESYIIYHSIQKTLF